MKNELDATEVAANLTGVLMENNRVRVFRATFQPRDKAAMHHHPDHVVYVLSGGKAKITMDGKTNVQEFKTGDAIFLNEQTHEVENIGSSVIDLIVVELK
jgi:beta-alanine degradation protein BauB